MSDESKQTIDYARFVKQLFAKRHEGIDALVHAAMGISGEAGELLDAIKKTWVYDKPLDMVNVIEELGDLEFYMQALRMSLKLDRMEILRANVEKLKKRYPQGYTNEAAIKRADKSGENHENR